MVSDNLFVTSLNSVNKEAKSIKNYLDLFVNTSLYHMSIRFCLVSQPNKKLYSNSEQLFNTADLLPMTFGVILFQIHTVRIHQILKIIWELWMRTEILKYILLKCY